MTTGTLESIRPAISELERFLDWHTARFMPEGIGEDHHTVVTIQTAGKQFKCNGYFIGQSRERKAKDGSILNKGGEFPWSTREGQGVCELTLGAQYLSGSPLEIMAIAAHENTHRYADAHGLKDCALSGRHSKVFKGLAESFGMTCAESDAASQGFNQTALTPTLAEAIEREFQPDYLAFNLFRTLGDSQVKKSKSTRVAYTCSPACDDARKITTHAGWNAVCGSCNEPYQPI